MTLGIRRAKENEYGVEWEIHDDSDQDAEGDAQDVYDGVVPPWLVKYIAVWDADHWREISK